MMLELSDDFINELQRRSIIRLIERAKQARSADIVLRLNGQDVTIEADWIKHLKFTAPQIWSEQR